MEVQIAEGLSPEVRDALRNTPIAKRIRELLQVAVVCHHLTRVHRGGPQRGQQRQVLAPRAVRPGGPNLRAGGIPRRSAHLEAHLSATHLFLFNQGHRLPQALGERLGGRGDSAGGGSGSTPGSGWWGDRAVAPGGFTE
jgi:hypothetical protein